MYQRLLYTRISGRSVLSTESCVEQIDKKEIYESSLYLYRDMMDPFPPPIHNILFFLLVIVLIYNNDDDANLSPDLTINTYYWDLIIHLGL